MSHLSPVRPALKVVSPFDPLTHFHQELNAELARLTEAPDEAALDPLWSDVKRTVAEYTLRPSKRVRPTLTALGWLVAQPESPAVPHGVVRFAAGLELLHTFMLVHDDVADRAATRRGGPSLHAVVGADPAIVLGDHLYARAIEAMLSAPSPAAAVTTRYVLEVCRHTAAGQYLDLKLQRAPLADVTLFRALKVAELKTARYGFVAPLACGAMLGGAPPALLEALKRAGRHAGLAYQLRDDLIGLYGDDSIAGKAGGGDYLEGKRTFPLLAAWTRADAAGRAELEGLWAEPSAPHLDAARVAVSLWGGLDATQRVIETRTRMALKALESIGESAATLASLVHSLARRTA